MFPSLFPNRRPHPQGNPSFDEVAPDNPAAVRKPTACGPSRDRRWQGTCLAACRFLLSGLAEICYPPTCVLCHGPLAADCLSTLCEGCRATLRATAAEFACDRCSRPQPPISGAPVSGAPVSKSLESRRLCPACGKRSRGGRSSGVERSLALGMYRDVMREAVVAAKRLSFQPLTLALGEMLGERVREAWGAVPIGAVTFVPSHWMRRWGRGGCPAELLAVQVGRVIEAPVIPLLRSRRRTAKQGTLGDAERRTNVRGAFRVKKGYALLAPRVLVVDDVWTTGATLQEAARVIRQGYDAEVFAAVVARAIGTHDG